MENATKALLIAAVVLISIVLISIGVYILTASNNTSKQTGETSTAINIKTHSAVNNIKSTLESMDNQENGKNNSGEVKVISIEIEANEYSSAYAPGETLTLKAIVKPDNATNKEVKWTSSNSGASVSSSGQVTFGGSKTQQVTIKATAADGSGISASKSFWSLGGPT